jgi:hypothetical protein
LLTGHHFACGASNEKPGWSNLIQVVETLVPADQENVLALFNRIRLEFIRSVITECWHRTDKKSNSNKEFELPYAFFTLGSHALHLALPSSDLELGFLCDEPRAVPFNVDQFLQEVKKNLEKNEVFFDHNQWFPYFNANGTDHGSPLLRGTCAQLASIKDHHENTVLRYALNHTNFLWGNKKLYERFAATNSSTQGHLKRALKKEFLKTHKRIKHIHMLYEHLEFYLQKKRQKHSFRAFNLKPHLTKPLIELICYMAIYNELDSSNIFECLATAQQRTILPHQLGKKIKKALTWGLQKRILNNDSDYFFESIDQAFFHELEAAWSTLIEFESFLLQPKKQRKT